MVSAHPRPAAPDRALVVLGLLAVVVLHNTLSAMGEDISDANMELRNRKLFDAAEDANVDAVRDLLASGADPNGYVGPDGTSALISAANQGLLEVVEMLHGAGGTINQRTTAGWTSLMVACAEGHTDVVAFLLAQNATLDLQTFTGYSALMMASARGQTGAVELLLAHGARTDLRDPYGVSALMLAASKGHLSTVSVPRVKIAGCSGFLCFSSDRCEQQPADGTARLLWSGALAGEQRCRKRASHRSRWRDRAEGSPGQQA